MSRKVLHLENRASAEHKYYGSMDALLKDNPALPYYTVRRIKEFPYEHETFVIREGVLLSNSDLKQSSDNA